MKAKLVFTPAMFKLMHNEQPNYAVFTANGNRVLGVKLMLITLATKIEVTLFDKTQGCKLVVMYSTDMCRIRS